MPIFFQAKYSCISPYAILNMMRFSYISIYSRVTTRNFLGNHSSTNNFSKYVYPKNNIYATWLFLKNPIKKPLTSEVKSKFISTGHCIQPIKLLGPSPSTLEPRNTSIKPINNKAYYKLHYQICLHKSEMIPSKIKPKALKLSLTIPRQVPLPKWEPNKHTRNS